MDNSFNITRLILIILFVVYQFWAFKNKKSVKHKLYPMICVVIIGTLLMALLSFTSLAGYYFIFFILTIELSLLGSILVIAIEIFLALFDSIRNMKKVIFLTITFILLTVVYYVGQKVF